MPDEGPSIEDLNRFGSDEAQTLSVASVNDLLDEIDALRQAEASGVVVDAAYPEYHFRLWLAFGRPAI